MLRKTLIGLALLATLNCNTKKEEVKESPVQSRVICEYYDTDNNGYYDTYRLFRKSEDKSEVILRSDGLGGKIEFRDIYYFTPSGGPALRDATRGELEFMFRDRQYKYPCSGVDSIMFID